jgi:uncharacterized protein
VAAVVPRPLPLFPLPNVVLFPRLSLPLHVFEPRYRKLVADALQSHRVIGMALLRPGYEADYHGRPPVYPVGCAGRIERCVPLADGRFDVLLHGFSRFRILDERPGEPYRLANVEPLADDPGDDAALAETRRKLMRALGTAEDGPAVLVTQPDVTHEVFVNALSQTLDLAPVERQSLLDCDGLLARSRRLLEILEWKALEAAHGGSSDTIH